MIIMKSKAETVDEYLDELSDERRETVSIIRKLILEHLPEGYQEAMQYGMISYIIPFDIFPDTYNKQPLSYLSLASQKNNYSLYMSNVYADQEINSWFIKEYKESGKRMDMGKSCVRFKKLDNLPLDLIGEAISKTTPDEYIQMYKRVKKMA